MKKTKLIATTLLSAFLVAGVGFPAIGDNTNAYQYLLNRGVKEEALKQLDKSVLECAVDDAEVFAFTDAQIQEYIDAQVVIATTSETGILFNNGYSIITSYGIVPNLLKRHEHSQPVVESTKKDIGQKTTKKVTVTLPTFPVSFGDSVTRPLYDEYPVMVYKDITYFPMTSEYSSYLGLSAHWDNQTLTVEQVSDKKDKLNWYERTKPNKKIFQAQTVPFTVVVNGRVIDNSKEPYPLLFFNNITYFPLTWKFAVEEFGWAYQFDEKNGLQIESKEI